MNLAKMAMSALISGFTLMTFLPTDDSLKNAVEEEEDDEVEVSGESELQKRGIYLFK